METLFRVLFGTCPCGRKFWWTGTKDNCPDCGGCGRQVKNHFWFKEKSVD
jgi:hypothetical protein